MDPVIIGAIIFAIVFFLLFTGLPVAVSLGLSGIIGALIFGVPIGIIQRVPWQMLTSFVIIAIPLFIFMGQIMFHSRTGALLFNGTSALLRKVPGGLLHTNIVTCAIFAAVSGSSVATAATIGIVAIPELEKRGYDMKITFGSLAAGGTLGILIPPSINMIVYGAFVGESIGHLFIAGIFPGIMLAGLFMVYIGVRTIKNPRLAPPVADKMSLKETTLAVVGMWPIFIVMTIVLGGIYLGVMTPTETAGVGAIVALVIAAGYRRVNWSMLLNTLRDTVKTTTFILFIMIGALILSTIIAKLRVPDTVITLVAGLQAPRLVVLMGIYLVYLFLGCFMDGISMMVLTLPFCYPVIVQMGYDPIWFGVTVVILIEMAMLTPPVGINVYTIHGLRPDRPLSEVLAGSIPFFLMMIVGLAIVTTFPIIATWLPATMRTVGG